MRKILIIGIGAGNPEHITIQAINALRRMNVLFMTDKGPDKSELAQLRHEICERYVPEATYRTVEISDPPRDRQPANYRGAVDTWHGQRADIYERLISEHVGENECGAFLAWGDPSLYDSIIRIIDQIATRGTVSLDYEVIPGITSVQALTAAHRIPLNRIGEPVQITTGRQLADSGRTPDGDVVVMLDGECAFKNLTDDELEIYWGAYLGTADEVLLSGKLREVSDAIQATRAAARQRKGWIMDTYLLRKPAGPRH
jgi:precorrin-6A synthase